MPAKNSDSSKRSSLKEYLKVYADGKYNNSIVEFLPDSGEYLIFVPGVIDPFTEKMKKMLERRALKDLGILARVTQISSKVDTRTSAALEQVLLPILGENLIEVGVTTPTPISAEVVVFVHDYASASIASTRDRTMSKTHEFLRTYDLQLEAFYFNELADGVPSAFQILRIIYCKAPVTLNVIESELLREQAAAPTGTWLKRQLDSLVKKKFVLWQKPGTYVLTSMGIQSLPAKKGPNSLDVIRALELSRKKW